MTNRILVAGASGKLGRLVVQQLKSQGYWVRVLSRSELRWTDTNVAADEIFIADLVHKNSLSGVCNGIDAVISCAGASMDIKKISDRLAFPQVDFQGNANLLADAKRANVKKFVYVSVAHADKMLNTEYCSAHYRFEQSLAESGMKYTIVQPTGFFYFLAEIISMARNGRGIVIGDGSSATNPIHEIDVANVCVEALTKEQSVLVIGGPEIFSREQIVELAFSIANRKGKIIHLSPRLFSLLILPMKLANPRIHALLEFGAVVSVTNVVAPSYGKHVLREYFQSLSEQEPHSSQ